MLSSKNAEAGVYSHFFKIAAAAILKNRLQAEKSGTHRPSLITLGCQTQNVKRAGFERNGKAAVQNLLLVGSRCILSNTSKMLETELL
jgi:hypothetical protein